MVEVNEGKKLNHPESVAAWCDLKEKREHEAFLKEATILYLAR